VKLRVYGKAGTTSTRRTEKDNGVTQKASLPNTQWSCWLTALGEGLFFSCISCNTIQTNKLHKKYKKHTGPFGVTHFKDSTTVLNWRIFNKCKERDEQLVKCAFLKKILYLCIRMGTKQTLVIIDAYHVPKLYPTIFCEG